MRIIKKTVASALLILVIFLSTVTGGYLFVDDTVLIPLLSGYLESITGTRITYSHDALITRTLSPLLHINNLVIEDTNKAFYVHLKSLKLQMNLLRLLSGKLEVPLLLLGDSKIEIQQSNSATPLSIPESLPLFPVFHDIQVSKVEISHGGDEIIIPAVHLSELVMSLEPETDNFVLLMNVGLAESSVQLKATLPQIHQSIKTQQLPFAIVAKNSTIDLSTDGNINFQSSPPEIQASVSFQAPTLQPIFSGINDFEMQGALTGKAEIDGTFEQLTAQDVMLSWEGPGQSKASVHGTINNVVQLSGCELKLDSHLEELTWLASVLPESLGTLQSTDITAQIACPGKQADKHLAVTDFRLQVKTVEELDLLLTGQFNLNSQNQGGVTPEKIDLKLQFSAPTTRSARLLFFENIWEFGAISGQANILSTNGIPAIEGVVIKARDHQGIEVDLTGRIDKFPLDPDISNTGYDLDVTMRSAETATMTARFDLNIPLPGPLEVKYKIAGDSQPLQLNDINLTAGKADGVYVKTTGSLHFGNWDQDAPLENIDLTVQATSHDIKTLQPFWGQQIPDFGALTAQGVVHTVSGKHRIDNFRLQSAEGAALQISLSGSAEQVTISPQPGINGIQLKSEVNAAHTTQIYSIFGLQKSIPPGPFKATADINGSHNELTINNVSGFAGNEESILVEFQGKAGKFGASSSWSPQETDLNISAHSTNSKSFMNLLGFHFPELGPITARASLKEKEHKMRLELTQITLGDPAEPTLAANGHIYDFFAFKEIELGIKLNLDGHSFAALSDSIALPDLQPLVGEIVISDSDGTLGIELFHLKSSDETLLNIEAKGAFNDFEAPDTLSLTAHLRANELLLIGALFNQQWPAVGPVQLDTEIQKKGEILLFNTVFSAGDMKINSTISGVFTNKPPKITGNITAHSFFLPSGSTKTIKNSEKAEAENGMSPTKHVFSRNPIKFSWLKEADLDLSIDIETFDEKWSKAKSAHFGITLQSGNLQISPAKITYPQGELTFDINLNTKKIPEVQFKARAQGLDPWQTLNLKESNVSKEFNAEMDIDVQVSSSGISEHELASNMQGALYVKLKNGKIRNSLLDLIFLDFIGWTFSKVRPDKYADVKCGVADYTITDGVITTNALLIDTKSIIIAGEGEIDLENEIIDYMFLPKKKSALIKQASPVNIKGPLNNPSVKTVPWKTVVSTYGSWFFAPYLFVGIWATDLVTGSVKRGTETNPCLEYEKTPDKEHEVGVY